MGRDGQRERRGFGRRRFGWAFVWHRETTNLRKGGCKAREEVSRRGGWQKRGAVLLFVCLCLCACVCLFSPALALVCFCLFVLLCADCLVFFFFLFYVSCSAAAVHLTVYPPPLRAHVHTHTCTHTHTHAHMRTHTSHPSSHSRTRGSDQRIRSSVQWTAANASFLFAQIPPSQCCLNRTRSRVGRRGSAASNRVERRRGGVQKAVARIHAK